MSSLNVRRMITVIISVVAGLLATQIILLVLGTNWAIFGFEAIIVVVALSIATLIWVDKFLSAEILPE